MFSNHVRSAPALLLAALVLLLAGCTALPQVTAPAPAAPSPTAAAPSPAAGEVATVAAAPAPSPEPALAVTVAVTTTSAPGESAVDLLPIVSDLFESSLGIDFEHRDPASPGIEGVNVLEVTPPPGQPRTWVAHTVGLRNFETDQFHTIAVYTQVTPDSVAEVARVALREDPSSSEPSFAPDYLGPEGVSSAQIEQSAVWLAVEGGVGAHSGVFALLRWSGSTLLQEMGAFSSSPGVGAVRDVNGDGIGEVLVDETEYYVFCYACGVRIPAYGLWRWTGTDMEQVAVEPLPGDAPAEAQAINDDLMALAAHGLWSDVAGRLAEADSLVGADLSGTLAWNLALLRLNVEARRAQIETPSPYPLLDHVFYGDAKGAEAFLRAYSPEKIFSLQSPLIAGTVAEGWEESLATWIERSATGWLEYNPDLPAAYFLRAWASFLVGQQEAALADLEIAARSGDPFHVAALDFLRSGTAAPAAFLTARSSIDVRAGPGVSYPVVGELAAGDRMTVTGQFGEGSDHWWQFEFAAAPDGLGWVSAEQEADLVSNGEGVPRARPPALVGDVAERGRLFFSLPDSSGTSAIYVMDAVAGAEPMLVIGEARLPALHPQGLALAFANQRPDMLGVGGLDLRSGERLRYSFNVEDTLPRWSSDGDRLLFSSTREGDRRPRVYWLWADGAGDARSLRAGQDADWSAADGRIVFKGCDDSGAACGLYTMDADGGNAAPLSDNPGDSRPRWSPDGTSVVFMSDQRDGNWEIYRIDVAGRQITRLTDDPALDGLPVFSPDGRNLAFVSNRSGLWEILVMPAGGGTPVPLHALGADFPDWLDHGLDWSR